MVNPAIQDKRPYFRIRPKSGGAWCVGESRAEVEGMADGEPLDEYEIEEIWYTPDEFELMQEFDGW